MALPSTVHNGLEYREGIAFSGGISEPDEPALAVRDLTGALLAWIDVGVPDADRLHKASKAAPRVAVYSHRADALVRALAGARIHRADALELYGVDKGLLAALAERLERRTTLGLSISDRHLFVTIGGETLTGRIERLTLPAA